MPERGGRGEEGREGRGGKGGEGREGKEREGKGGEEGKEREGKGGEGKEGEGREVMLASWEGSIPAANLEVAISSSSFQGH